MVDAGRATDPRMDHQVATRLDQSGRSELLDVGTDAEASLARSAQDDRANFRRHRPRDSRNVWIPRRSR
jgi:hypothetical protein